VVFLHQTRGTCGQMELTAGVHGTGPTGHLVLSMLGYPCDMWHDNSKEGCVISDVTINEVYFFI
jgi:hypothetical protein